MEALVTVLLCLQQEQTVFRTEKHVYLPAVDRCKEGEKLLAAGDPKAAVEKFDTAIASPRIKFVECVLKIEDRPGDFLPSYAFLPYQYRGKAFLALAAKDRPSAERLLARAAEDFQKSADLGVASSAPLLKKAKEELERLRAAAPPPPPKNTREDLDKLRAAWEPLVAQQKFKSARALVEGRAEVPAADRKRLLDETDLACRALLDEAVVELRQRLSRLSSLRALRELEEQELEDVLLLPSPKELVLASPVLDWARTLGPALRDLRSGRGTPEALAAARAAERLDDRGQNAWFMTLENLAWESLRDGLSAAADRALRAPREERLRLAAHADGILKSWAAFAGGFPAPFRKRHPFLDEHGRELQAIVSRFPADIPELEGLDVGACFDAADPREGLRKLEERLKRLDNGRPATVESRRKLYGALVAVGALRALLAGKSEEEAAREVSAYAARLREAGGPLDPGRFGPRVEKVFEALR